MIEPNFIVLPKVRRRDILRRGLRCQCPNCGRSKLFKNLLRIHHLCPKCGMTLERGDGYYIGPLCINYGIVSLGFIAPVLIGGVSSWIPLKLALVLAIAGALFLPILLYQFCWSFWMMIYYLCLPDELHANRPEDSDDLMFEEEQRKV